MLSGIKKVIRRAEKAQGHALTAQQKGELLLAVLAQPVRSARIHRITAKQVLREAGVPF